MLGFVPWNFFPSGIEKGDVTEYIRNVEMYSGGVLATWEVDWKLYWLQKGLKKCGLAIYGFTCIVWKFPQKMVHFNVILHLLANCYKFFVLFCFFMFLKESKMYSACSVPCLQKIKFSFTQQVFRGSVMPAELWSL